MKFTQRSVSHRRDLSFIRDVSPYNDCLPAEVVNLVRDMFQRFLIARSQKHTGAFARKGKRNLSTDTATTACNDCTLVLKFHQSLRQGFEDYTITE